MPTKNTTAPEDITKQATETMGSSNPPAGDDPRGESAPDPTAAADAKDANAVNPVATRALADAFKDERDDVLAVVNELEDQLDQYEGIREALERDLAEANRDSQAAKQRAQELEWQAVTLQTRVDALEQVRQEVALLEEEIADANARFQRQGEQLTRSEKDNTRLKGDLKTANKQLEELWAVRKERDGLRVDIKNIAAKLGQLERAYKDTLEERATFQTQLQETQLALDEARSTRNQTEIALRTTTERNEELIAAQEELQQKLDATRNDKKTIQAQLTHVERENARLIEQQQYYECEITSLRSMNRSAEFALANVKKAFSEVRVALAETKSRARRRAIEAWPQTCNTRRATGRPISEGIEPNAITSIAATMPGPPLDDEADIVTENPQGTPGQ